MKKLYFYFVTVATLLLLLYLNAIQVKKASVYSKRASTFLWAMSDARLQMIQSFESILFKGLIKPVNQFE